MEAADLHNFGKSVQRIERGSIVLYRKPRPIYWEWLFFGKDSPLSVFFDQSRVSGVSPGEVIFNLITEIENDFCGNSHEVKASESIENKPSHLYSLGVLLAYCYLFGVRDLHKNNIIKTDSHLQVVDAEVVLAKILLPQETLLLPFKEVGPDLCGANRVLDIGATIENTTLEIIVSGYLDTFECILKNRKSILDVFQGLEPRMKDIPIRHILRDTIHYREWKTQIPEYPIFESELLQLKRGDVPYYFKFMDKSEVFEFTDVFGKYGVVQPPDAFLKGAAREGQGFRLLLEESRIRNQMLPAGLLYIVKILVPAKSNVKITGEGFEIQALETQIEATTSFGKFSAAR